MAGERLWPRLLEGASIVRLIPLLDAKRLADNNKRLNAEVQGLAALAGGGAAGGAAGGLTFAAVGALATASTGAAIGTLSGAAATSASLAWLGGGSLAAGGGGVAAGTAVLTGIVAAPVLVALGGFLWWQGKRSYNQQRQTNEELKQAEAALTAQRR